MKTTVAVRAGSEERRVLRDDGIEVEVEVTVVPAEEDTH